VYIFLFLSCNMLMFNKRVVNEICWGNIALTDCVISTTHVTIMTSSCENFTKCRQWNSVQNVYFGFFGILKIDRITSFCYLLMIRPSTWQLSAGREAWTSWLRVQFASHYTTVIRAYESNWTPADSCQWHVQVHHTHNTQLLPFWYAARGWIEKQTQLYTKGESAYK